MSGSEAPRIVVYSQDGLGLGISDEPASWRRVPRPADWRQRAHDLGLARLGRFFRPRRVMTTSSCRRSTRSAQASGARCRCPVLRRRPGASPRGHSISVLTPLPDVLLVDHMPHGAMGELSDAGGVAASPTASCWASTTSSTRPRSSGDSGVSRARRRGGAALLGCAGLWIQGRLRRGGGVRLARRGRPAVPLLRLCLLATRLTSTAASVRRRYLRDAGRDRDLIVAMAGGGADADALFGTCSSAAPKLVASVVRGRRRDRSVPAAHEHRHWCSGSPDYPSVSSGACTTH